ncbi:MAG TPA: DUF3857 domain-containing protein [Candidatus Acidoferrales bacterium]|nr:DUF3857 domain-containing protein [Candidatus Acidoferrales bacterium]
MKKTCVLFLVAFCFDSAAAQDFVRDLPKPEFANGITAPTMDAVIILKEHSITVKYQDLFYGGTSVNVPTTDFQKVMIVKLLDEVGVKRYANVEFTYLERLEPEYHNAYYARARVMKPDGTVQVMPEEDVQNIVELATANNVPLIRKVIFKIPNVSAGDVIQYEYGYSDIALHSYGGLYFYNDQDFALFSNLYITLPYKDKTKVFSFPPDKVGDPAIQQLSVFYGSGKTYFWTIKNLNGIPEEPYAYSFEATSLLTTFVPESDVQDSLHVWDHLAKKFYDEYIDKGKISDDEMESLSLPSDRSNSAVQSNIVDSLYARLRKYFLLEPFNSLYPRSGDIDDLFKSRKGDASDLSYIMYKILKRWGINGKLVWVRDNIDGPYEESVPSLLWFDRLAVLVSLSNEEKVYDFNRSVSSDYETPWSIEGIKAVVLDGDTCYQQTLTDQSSEKSNISFEKHNISILKGEVTLDSLTMDFNGRPAGELRKKYYEDERGEAGSKIRSQLSESYFSKVDSVSVNDFLNERDFKETVVGVPKNNIQKIDSFMVIKLGNVILSSFREKLFTTKRRNHIYFAVPLQLKLEWNVNFPQGYRLNDHLTGGILEGVASLTATTEVHTTSNGVDISLTVDLPDTLMSVDKYQQLMSFIDMILKKADREIVLRKS